MPTLQDIYYTDQSKNFSEEQLEQKATDVREQLQHDIMKVVHASNDLSATDCINLTDLLCKEICDYFFDEYGV